MLPWKRSEVYLGYSMTEFSKVREILSANGIRYDTRVADHSRFVLNQRAPLGTPSAHPDATLQYCVYVGKQDAEKADYILMQNQ